MPMSGSGYRVGVIQCKVLLMLSVFWCWCALEEFGKHKNRKVDAISKRTYVAVVALLLHMPKAAPTQLLRKKPYFGWRC